MATRADVLELAVLGLLHDSPMHGYELRKRLGSVLGPFRALSYGTLYPCLKTLSLGGWIAQSGAAEGAEAGEAVRTAGRRARIVYELTAAGKERFETLVAEAGPTSWDDDSFGVHFAFFARTSSDVRLRILEGRRSRLEERLEQVSTSLSRSRERADQYTLELQRHGLESVQREVRWLSELITAERDAPPQTAPPQTAVTTAAPPA